MSAATRAAVMAAGRCSFCGLPAERSAISGHWWHLERPTECIGFAIVPAGGMPKGPRGWDATFPPRFTSGDTP